MLYYMYKIDSLGNKTIDRKGKGKMAKVNTLSQDAKAILEVLKTANAPMTLSEINEINGTDFKTGTLVSLIKKGLITKGDEKEVEYVARKLVGTYKIGQ